MIIVFFTALTKFYEFQDTSKRASNDLQVATRKFNSLSKCDKDKIGTLVIGITIGAVGTSVLKK